MRKRTLIVAWFVVINSMIFSQSIQMTLPEMVDQSDKIVKARVTHTEARWVTDDRGKHIYTTVSVACSDFLKGDDTRQEFSFEIVGGTVDGITEWVSDMPVFMKGNEAVLFFSKDDQLIGGKQGKFEIKAGQVHGIEGSMATEVFMQKIQTLLKSGEKNSNILDTFSLLPMNILPARKILDIHRNDSLVLNKTIHSTSRIFPSPQGSQTIMSETFEGTFPDTGWIVGISSGYAEAYWGKDSYKPHQGSSSAWCAAAGSQASTSGGNYRANMESWMVYGPFDLSDAKTASLQFYLWNNSESNQDFLYWMASVDEMYFYGYGTSGNSNGWQSVSLDLGTVPTLGDITGHNEVWIAFIFLSNASIQLQGAYIDDVVLEKTVVSADDPVISSLTPEKTSAGTNTSLTITGSKFGDTQGNGNVEFFQESGEDKLMATIISWSDNSITCKVPSGASSGSVYVTNDAGGSANATFKVTFGYAGFKWPGVTPEVFYRINQNCSAVDDEKAQIQAAANTWSNAGSNFSLQYVGLTSATVASNNDLNEILWGTTSTKTIALTSIWYNDSGEILECDMTFNNSLSWSNDGTQGTYDIQTIALHEMGHYQCLTDLYGNLGDGEYDVAKVMYGYGSTGEVERTLHTDDLVGIQSIYGNSGSTALSVSLAAWDAPAAGGTSSAVTVTSSDATIVYSISDDASWLFTSESGGTTPGTFNIAATQNNTGSPRTATVTVTATSPSGVNGSPQTITVAQEDFESAVESSEDTLPISYALYQNHPNPFNPTTTIRYALPDAGEIRLSVFDLLGREVATLVSGRQDAGTYDVVFDASALSSGLYYYRLQASQIVLTKKLMLIR